MPKSTRNKVQRIFSTGFIWLWVSFIVIVLDRMTKIEIVQHLNYQEPFYVFSLLNLTLFHNTGAAFSFLHHASGWQNILLGSLAVGVSFILVCWLARLSRRDRWMSIALCCILGGALGNAWDRMLYGYVIDFLSFHWGDWYFAIFNVADSAICLGTFMLFCHWFLYRD
jgi:signal peptidase II